MKNNMKIFLTGIIALSVGIAAGYVLFSKGDAGHEHGHESSVATETEEGQIWTCSMHPQIQQNEPGDCPLCAMDLIPLEENSSDDPLVLEMTKEAVKLAEIQTTVVGGMSVVGVNQSKKISGKVQADERLASGQTAHVSGRIEKLFVSFTGETVRKGQKIANIYSPELIAAQGELLEAVKLQNVNPGLLEAARSKLRFLKIGEPVINNIEENGVIQETFTLYADETGTVSRRRVSVGDYVQKGEPLFDLINLSKVWVLFDAYEEDLGSIKPGDKIEFSTPSVPGKTFSTWVTFIDPFINSETRTASVRTEVSNPQGLLKPEMLVYGNIQNKSTTPQGLTVPKSAVLWTGTRSVVYVKVGDATVPSFQFREVELGEAQGDIYLIKTGLEAGEEVVTKGSFTIDAAAQLNNSTSMMNRMVEVKDEGQGDFLPDFTEVTPEAFKLQVEEIIAAYIAVKDALVDTDSETAQAKSAELAEALNQADRTLLPAEALEYWMQEFAVMNGHNKMLGNTNLVEEQRIQFDLISQALIDVVKVFGLVGQTVYVQYCPMAFDDEGADWLSMEEDILNPYFGDKMLRCGLVKLDIDETFKNSETTADF